MNLYDNYMPRRDDVVCVTMTMPRALHESLKRTAERKGTSVSYVSREELILAQRGKDPIYDRFVRSRFPEV